VQRLEQQQPTPQVRASGGAASASTPVANLPRLPILAAAAVAIAVATATVALGRLRRGSAEQHEEEVTQREPLRCHTARVHRRRKEGDLAADGRAQRRRVGQRHQAVVVEAQPPQQRHTERTAHLASGGDGEGEGQGGGVGRDESGGDGAGEGESGGHGGWAWHLEGAQGGHGCAAHRAVRGARRGQLRA